ncbi:MAG TPA: hypothetical protein VFJ30_02915 [Phycisphaerae bacterium]|nr:hypothetical protein [Phycisphaerae bacterium]
MAKRSGAHLTIRLFALAALAAAVAYVEAGATALAREVAAPARREHFPQSSGEAVPVLGAKELQEIGPAGEMLVRFEQARGAAAVLILAAAALGIRRRRGEGLALLLIALGARTVVYYVALWVLTGWPGSLGTWDVLLRLPVPAVAPVWAPLAVAGVMLVAGVIRLGRCASRLTPTARLGPVAGVVLGVAAIAASFVLRGTEALKAAPAGFDWPWFVAGWLLLAAGLLWLSLRPAKRGP